MCQSLANQLLDGVVFDLMFLQSDRELLGSTSSPMFNFLRLSAAVQYQTDIDVVRPAVDREQPRRNKTRNEYEEPQE